MKIIIDMMDKKAVIIPKNVLVRNQNRLSAQRNWIPSKQRLLKILKNMKVITARRNMIIITRRRAMERMGIRHMILRTMSINRLILCMIIKIPIQKRQ